MESKFSPRRLEAARKRAEALRLRLEGLSYREIGEKLGCRAAYAYRLVGQEMERVNRLRSEVGIVATQIEMARLDRLTAALWDKAMAGNPQAVDSVLRIMGRRAKLLGLDKPTQIVSRVSFGSLSEPELLAKAKQLGLSIPEGLVDGPNGRANQTGPSGSGDGGDPETDTDSDHRGESD